MQWTKVSNKYAELLFSDATDGVFRTYIRLMLLVSSMEFAPNLNQLSTKLGRRKVQTLLSYIEEKQKEFGEDAISLSLIIEKVMEDVDAVKKKREGGKERQKKHRVTHDVTALDKNKIRLDKIREDNKERTTWFLEYWKQYPVSNRQGKKEALKRFLATVKNEEQFSSFKNAFSKYINSKQIKDGYILRGSKWFGEWEDWVEYSGDPAIKERSKI